MTSEREREIRNRLYAFKHWKKISDNPASYLESHGPDMEELLAEVDKLKWMNQKYKADMDFLAKSRDHLREGACHG